MRLPAAIDIDSTIIYHPKKLYSGNSNITHENINNKKLCVLLSREGIIRRREQYMGSSVCSSSRFTIYCGQLYEWDLRRLTNFHSRDHVSATSSH
jgi:hypothetical protein